MDALLYIRFSTKDQDKGDSIRRQTQLAQDVAKARGLRITETLLDRGKSAYHAKNRAKGGKLYEIEERAQRGELAGKVLLVEAMDRLSREKPLESLTLVRDLTKCGVTICVTSSNRIYNTKEIDDNWTNLIVILAGAAEAYGSSHEKSKRVRSAWRKTQATGQMKDSKGADQRLCPDWIEVRNGEYAVREDRADLVRRMFDMSAKGYGLRAISDALKPEQARIGWPEGALDIRRVNNLLRGRRVLGEYQPQTRTPTGGREDAGPPVKLYPAIVTLKQWHDSQKGLESRKNTGGPRRQAINVLSHLARCHHHGEDGLCGSRMTYRGHKKQQPQLVCQSFARAAGCKCNATYRYQSLLDGILDELGTLPFPNTAQGEPADDLGEEWLELKRKKDRLEQLADRLMLEDDPIKEQAYQRFRRQVADEEGELLKRRAGSERASVTLSGEELAKAARALRDQLESSPEARLQMQTYLDQLIDMIVMDPRDRTATVVMFGGWMNFKLDKTGAVIARAGLDIPVSQQTLEANVGKDRVAQYNRAKGGR
ncbi:MAG: hypothetical protein C0456_19280 [Hyphomonas sp.]|uniref:recombinase family protein n=1 Tax=Hyphomonas sp. TaxID=87 RepID=UPI001DFBB5B1|nr:recombinase family protein [Hyphomonas sp.]MBA4228751.1 hypothetical protein [Hyphomonas sp.]